MLEQVKATPDPLCGGGLRTAQREGAPPKSTTVGFRSVTQSPSNPRLFIKSVSYVPGSVWELGIWQRMKVSLPLRAYILARSSHDASKYESK